MVQSSAIPVIVLIIAILGAFAYFVYSIWPKRKSSVESPVTDKVSGLVISGNPTMLHEINAHIIASNIVVVENKYQYLNNPFTPVYAQAFRVLIAHTGSKMGSYPIEPSEVEDTQIAEITHDLLQLMNRTHNYKGMYLQAKRDGILYSSCISAALATEIIKEMAISGVHISAGTLVYINSNMTKIDRKYN